MSFISLTLGLIIKILFNVCADDHCEIVFVEGNNFKIYYFFNQIIIWFIKPPQSYVTYKYFYYIRLEIWFYERHNKALSLFTKILR